jgi:hypothetical protein
MLFRNASNAIHADGFAMLTKGDVDVYIASKATPRRSPRSRMGLVMVLVQTRQCVMLKGPPIRNRQLRK